MDISIEDINEMNIDMYLESIGWVFEHSPWIAEKAWECRPFQSIEELLQTMITVVKQADQALQLSLIRAHPDLGTRLKISEISRSEQKGVGLDKLSKAELQIFQNLNKSYVENFDFPFIIAVKGHRKETILEIMKERIHSSYEDEFNTALNEIFKIASYRLYNTIDKGA